MKNEYITTSCKDIEDLQTYKACFDNNDDPKSLLRLEWMHFKNPVEECYVDFAVHEESKKIGGLYAVFPVRFKYFKDTIIGSQSIDTLVDKHHRRKGLFKKLAASLYERCKNNGVQFVYGFPNDQSAFAFFNRLEWTPIGDVPFLIKIINLKYIKEKLAAKSKALSYLVPGLKLSRTKEIQLQEGMVIKEIEGFFPSEIDTIWNAFSQNINFAVHRDSKYLNWRIFEKPEQNYQVNGLYDNDKLVGFIAFVISEKHGGRIGYVVEYMYLPTYKEAAENLLIYADKQMSLGGADAILAWNFQHSPNHKAFKKIGFIKFPEKLKPIKLFFGIRFFENHTIQMKDWYISYCDSDTV